MRFRDAVRDDVPAVVALLRDDVLSLARETEELAPYLAAFDRVAASRETVLVVGEEEGRVVATYQLSILPGLSRRGALRAVVEAVRVASDRRSRGIGARLMTDAEARARAAGCILIQLTTDRSRHDAHRFYERLGFEASHVGYKRLLT
jgi:GNAT superfamily N-acetyltransferase